MKVRIYSDPHLEAQREAHTTFESRTRLRSRIADTVMTLLIQPGADYTICLGDLFDRYSNPEEAVKSAIPIVERTDLVLAGNHDLVNRESKIGSLQLLHEFFPNKFLISDWGAAESSYFDVGKTRFAAIPHVISQDLFGQAVGDAISAVEQWPGYKVLLLHCNYDRGYTDGTETAINLPSSMAADLLRHFHTIFLGHEHHPAEFFEGRLVLLGNTYPTSFSDLSDKRTILYDTELGSWESHLHLSASSLGWTGKASILSQSTFPYITLEDDLPVGEVNKIVTSLFKKHDVFAVRLMQKPRTEGRPEVVYDKMETLPELVSKELENQPEMRSWWNELTNRAQAEQL